MAKSNQQHVALAATPVLAVGVEGVGAAISQGKDVVRPLNELHISESNVRKTYNAENIAELAALIDSQGLLQNLSITEDGGVIAGGRRLRALWLLRDTGRLAANAPVACKLYASDRGIAVSTAENSGREQMHPADEFLAYAAMVQDGKTIEQVAAQFGVTPLFVERRLALSKLHPRFIDLYREGKANLDQLKTLCLTADHALQVAVWDSLGEHQRSVYHLKQQILNGEVEASNATAVFVGLAVYEAAGGTVRRDLFDESDKCWLQDTPLLHRLADEKLAMKAEEARAAGWSWVEARQSVGYSDLNNYGREYAKARKMTTEEEACMQVWLGLLDDAEKVMEAHCDADDHDLADEASDALANIEEIIAELRESLEGWTPKQLAACGVMLSIDHNGELKIQAGLVRPEDKKAKAKEAVEALKKAGKPIPADLQSAQRATFSERLMHDLTAHRTAALQAALVDDSHAALALVVHGMAMPIFVERYNANSPLKLVVSQTTHTPLSDRAAEYDQSPAAQVLADTRAQWGEKVPSGDARALYRWLLQQDTNTLLDLLAFCAANGLDAMHGRERAALDVSDELAEALQLDMADWWTPTPAKYLDSVSKAQLVEAVTEACGAEAVKPVAAMKKAEAVAYCAAQLDGKRWLPAPLRRKVEQDSTDTDAE